MKIRLNHGPNFGQITHVQRDQNTTLLVALNLIEELAEDTPRPRQPRPDEPVNVTVPVWEIALLGNTLKPAIRYRHGTASETYAGPPEGAAHGFQHKNWRGEVVVPEPPTQIVEQYSHALATFNHPARSINNRDEIERAMEAQKTARLW